eukprot:2095335-Amphidinium_carterae.1
MAQARLHVYHTMTRICGHASISFEADDVGSAVVFTWGLLAGDNYLVLAEYKLCWCNYLSNCTDLDNFRGEAGSMTAKGPYLDDIDEETGDYQAVRSVRKGAGQPVAVSIRGVNLEAGDSVIMVTEEGGCGENATLAFESFVVDTSNCTACQDARSDTADGATHQWTRAQVPNGGQFIMCWCAVDCNVLANFAIYV